MVRQGCLSYLLGRALFLPDDFEIPIRTENFVEDRNAGLALPGFPSVASGREVMSEGRGSGKEQSGCGEMGSLGHAGNVFLNHDGSSGEAVSGGVRKEGKGPFFSVDEVFAHGVSPVHLETCRLHGGGGVGLVEEVIESVLVVGSVNVVHPTKTRAEVELGTVTLRVSSAVGWGGSGMFPRSSVRTR